MNKLTKAIVLGTVAVATLISTLEVAPAGERYWRDRGWHGDRGWRHHHGYRDDAVAAGVLGLAAGVIVGGALSQPSTVYEEAPVYEERDVEYIGPVDGYADPDDDVYVQPREYRRSTQISREAQDDGYFPDRPVKRQKVDVADQGTLEPWTAKWRSYCKQRFSSFNATTGTYKGYDGKSHFCTAG